VPALSGVFRNELMGSVIPGPAADNLCRPCFIRGRDPYPGRLEHKQAQCLRHVIRIAALPATTWWAG